MTGPHPFTLRQLQYVVAVAELRSFRRAAERCRVSQPSLSAQVALVEDALGVVLFERGRGGVRITAAGAAVVQQARRVLVDADDLLSLAQRWSDPFQGTWRVGVIPTVSPYLLPSLAPALREAWPALNLVWVEDRTPALARALAAGELDAAVVALEAELGDVDHEELGTDDFVLATGPTDALGRSRRPVAPGELDGASVLLLDDGHCFRDQALAVCAGAGAHELGFRATSLPTLAQMVAGGSGVTLLPRLAVATEAARAGLKVRRFAEPAPHRTVALVWRRGSALTSPLRELGRAMRRAWPPA